MMQAMENPLRGKTFNDMLPSCSPWTWMVMQLEWGMLRCAVLQTM